MNRTVYLLKKVL